VSHSCRAFLCETPHYEEPIDTGYTDETIEIECGECNRMVTGVDAMAAHIMETHPSYSALESVNTACLWADSAYEREEDNIRNQEPDVDDDPL